MHFKCLQRCKWIAGYSFLSAFFFTKPARSTFREEKKQGNPWGKKTKTSGATYIIPLQGNFKMLPGFSITISRWKERAKRAQILAIKRNLFWQLKKMVAVFVQDGNRSSTIVFFFEMPRPKKDQNSQATLCSMKSSKGGTSLCFLASCHASKTPARNKESVHAFCCAWIKPAFRSRDVIRVAWRWIELRGSSSLVEWSQVSHNVHLVPETPRSSKVSSAEALLSTKNLRAFNKGFWRNTAP